MDRTARAPSAGSGPGAAPGVPSGWALTGWIALALLAASAVHFALMGTGVEGVRGWIRATARSSLLLFLLAFCARPLRQLWRAPLSAWLLRNRRYLGVGFACSHALHGVAILWFAFVWPEIYQADTTTLVAGGVTYVFIALMTATSSDRAFAWLGRARWQALHRTGVWTIWFVFLATFGGQAAASPIHAGSVALLLAAAGLRLAAYLRRRRRTPAPA